MSGTDRLLLDTHAALWWWSDPTRLGAKASELLAEADCPIAVSAVSALEIANKFRLGKLPDIGDPAANFRRLMDRNGFDSLSVNEAHALRAGLLPGEHRDPFDRLIAAQALIEDMVVVTRDRAFIDFGCKVIW
ncbi:type II toxin-antitoxin system VapC family toxin [Sphingomonas naphthae]|uniref:Type II toxin-antitoxin system VapC family toxin n=1 Tax=Sphingomonas naphthae TaxID=1813468 RepID=A0ABY7TJH6_9SPHN|nr:type II toxin-antitoxin system VapC family toxin [Sphingomonas naphthae]WCT73355.1 type II toxin-antitoxin system VapC family toxin [Sphingomonas naphthae]